MTEPTEKKNDLNLEVSKLEPEELELSADEQELCDLKEELRCKEQQLKDNKLRQEGGEHLGLKRYIPSIEEELNYWSLELRCKELEQEYYKVIDPFYEFEKNEEWLNCRRELLGFKIAEIKRTVSKIKKQADDIAEDNSNLPGQITELQSKIKELESKIASEVTD